MRNYGLFSLLLALLVSAGLARLMLQLRQQALDNLREAALARQRAEKANQAKSELLAIATHDLKNPLSAISSMAELLINLKTTNQVLPTQEIACLQNIRESSRHMFALVRRILDNEKLESGMLALEKTTVDLTALCRSVIAANIRAAEGKQLHIVANLPESLVVEADTDHLLEAFDNYLNVAWGFGGLRQPPRQGGLLLGTAAASIGDVTIAAVTLRRQQIVHRCHHISCSGCSPITAIPVLAVAGNVERPTSVPCVLTSASRRAANALAPSSEISGSTSNRQYRSAGAGRIQCAGFSRENCGWRAGLTDHSRSGLPDH